MRLLRRHFADHPDIGRPVSMISDDEDNHLAYCHEELLRLAAAGYGRMIQALLRESVRAEIRVYREVSLAVIDHMGRLLGWLRAKSALLAAGVHGILRVRGGRRLAAHGLPADARATQRAGRARDDGARVRLTRSPCACPATPGPPLAPAPPDLTASRAA